MAVMRYTRRHIAGAATAAIAALTLGVGAALPASAAPAAPQGVIENAGATGAIAGKYIVVLDESAPEAGSSEGRSLAKKFGAEITRTYDAALNGYAVELTEAEAKRFAADPNVEAVVQDTKVSINTTQANPPSWGLDRIDQPARPVDSSYTYPDSAGAGVTAYIIDTGVRITHNDFGGRASYGYDAVDDDSTADDGNGHGTHVAGTVAGTSYGVAKQADIVAVRVLDDEGSGTTAGVVAGIDWVTDNAVLPAVANMSLGGGADTALDTAVANSIAAGITYAVAAGNDNANASSYSPARVGAAITVGATASTDARASYSNYGSVLDIFAPGSSIVSASNTSNSATATLSGTSMASPHVAGAAALYLADNTSATPATVRNALVAAGSSVVTGAGSGSPTVLLQVPDGGSEDPGDPGDPGTSFTNANNYTISDFTTINSPITVSGLTGNAPSDLAVTVDIVHTYIGDLRIQLIAPDGTVYTLKAYSTGGSTDNLATTYTVNASSETANGTWNLRVTDNYSADTGYINSWTLGF